jgi:hypothetical protein
LGAAQVRGENRMKRNERCEACGLSHWKFFDGPLGERWCIPCTLHEIIVQDKKAISGVLKILRENKICAYCGELAEEVEHVQPRRNRLETWTVPACKECNRLAGGRVFPGFYEKREYIRLAIRKKYSKELSMPEWDQEELGTVKGRLREKIEASLAAREVTKQRLDFDWLRLYIQSDVA